MKAIIKSVLLASTLLAGQAAFAVDEWRAEWVASNDNRAIPLAKEEFGIEDRCFDRSNVSVKVWVSFKAGRISGFASQMNSTAKLVDESNWELIEAVASSILKRADLCYDRQTLTFAAMTTKMYIRDFLDQNYGSLYVLTKNGQSSLVFKYTNEDGLEEITHLAYFASGSYRTL